VALANRIGKKLRPNRAEIETTILALCNGRYLTLRLLAELLNRSDAGKFRDRYLTPMVADGRLERLHDNPAHPGQAYKTKGT